MNCQHTQCGREFQLFELVYCLDFMFSATCVGILDHADLLSGPCSLTAISSSNLTSSSKRIRFGFQRLCQEVINR